MIENFDSMIAASLQLEEPWYVSGATYDPEKQQMDIWVKARENAKLAVRDAGHRRSAMGMSRMSGHGGTRTACSFRAMFIANAQRCCAGSAARSRSTLRLSVKTAALP